MNIRLVLFCLLIWHAGAAMAAKPPHALAPGEYITERGWGVLSIGPTASGGQTFSLEATGANAHICTMEGRIVRGLAELEGANDRLCRVVFRKVADGISVEDDGDGDACRAYCGARAGFPGTYLRPLPGCAPTAVKDARARFKRQYEAKSHGEAVATLAPVLSRCARTLAWQDESWIRNDLALAQARAGNKAACRATLAPLRDLAEERDEDLEHVGPPAEAYANLRIARATRTNLALCAERPKR